MKMNDNGNTMELEAPSRETVRRPFHEQDRRQRPQRLWILIIYLCLVFTCLGKFAAMAAMFAFSYFASIFKWAAFVSSSR